MVDERVRVIESVPEGERSWALISLVTGLSIPNSDATEGRKHNLAQVPYCEYYYTKYSPDPRFNLDE
jgi:hypothetical protein